MVIAPVIELARFYEGDRTRLTVPPGAIPLNSFEGFFYQLPPPPPPTPPPELPLENPEPPEDGLATLREKLVFR